MSSPPLKISVITACYNSATTIADTLRTVNAQTHPDVEHVIIDGGSTDETLDIVRTQGQRVTTLVSEPDRGIYDAMNKGLALASGDVIGFLNADDHFVNNKVLTNVAQVMRDYDLEAVFGDVGFFHAGYPDRLIRRYRSNRFKPERIAWGWMPAHPTLFVRREVFQRVGRFRPDYHIAGDFEWVARAFKPQALRYRYLPEVMVHMRTGGISTGGWRNTVMLNREVMRACRENGISTNWLKLLSKYPIKLLEFLLP